MGFQSLAQYEARVNPGAGGCAQRRTARIPEFLRLVGDSADSWDSRKTSIPDLWKTALLLS